MASYRIEFINATTASIKLGRAKIGHAVQRHDDSGNWFGTMQVDGRRFEYNGLKGDMLRGLVQQANRVALCGSNNPELARKALAENNAKVVARAAAQWQEIEPIREALGAVANALGVRMPTGPRIRSRKIIL